MKRVPFFYYIMACLLSICITACDKEEQLIEDEIPEMIKADLSKRYPSVEILNYQEYSNFSQINVIDKDQNEASIWYPPGYRDACSAGRSGLRPADLLHG